MSVMFMLLRNAAEVPINKARMEVFYIIYKLTFVVGSPPIDFPAVHPFIPHVIINIGVPAQTASMISC